jgi:hypothetical protein
MNDFDVEKPLPSVIVIKGAESHLYRIGLSLFSFGSQTRNRFHNPFFILFIICVQTLKSITAILLKEGGIKRLLIGDFAYFLNGGNFLNTSIILCGISTFISQLLHYWKYYKNESPSYLKPFEMICGLVSPKSIGLINREDMNLLLKKSKLMFVVSKISIIGMIISGNLLSLIPLIINCSPALYLIEIFWILLFTIYCYFCANINFSQMAYFYIICLYLKLKLRNANNSIRKSFEKKHKMTNYRIKNILISLDSIISEINTYNNDFWSKYLMFFLILVIIVLDITLFEAIFGKMSFFFKIIMFYASIGFFLLLIIIISTASSVSFEAKKSYILLNKLFITIDKNKISITIKIRV